MLPALAASHCVHLLSAQTSLQGLTVTVDPNVHDDEDCAQPGRGLSSRLWEIVS